MIHRILQTIMYVYGWLFVRPRRWVFYKMACNSSIRWLPGRDVFDNWRLPNIHWWLLYHTVFSFFKWLSWSAWCRLCVYENGRRKTFPWYARFVKWFGDTTAGMACSGFGECYHCGCEAGDYGSLEPIEYTNKHTYMTDYGTGNGWTEKVACPVCGYVSWHDNGDL